MKKILFLLLFTIASYGQAVFDEGIQVTGNTTSTTATKVNVQETDGTINTISKSDLVNVVEVNDVPSLPLIGEVGKIYVVKNVNKIYRWNGTFYQELSVTDISGKEDIANKQNSLAVDGTNTKYPTVTAVNTVLDLKANLASPALTDTPTAPTATAGTNTTQIATTAFVLANVQSIPQLESNATDKTVWNNGKGNISGNTSFGDNALKSNTTGYSNTASGYVSLSSNTTGAGNVAYGTQSLLLNIDGNNNTASGVLSLSSNTTGNRNTGFGGSSLSLNTTGSDNTSLGFNAGRLMATGFGLTIANKSVFIGQDTRALVNNSNNEIVIGANAIGAGSNTATLGSVSITNTILRGTVTTNGSFIKSSAPTTNILLAGGGDIAQNTAFNKNFGTTAGTVVEGGTLGSNAYTSTDYFKYETFTADANTLPENRSAFTYALNAPHTGTLVYFGAVGYGTQINTNSSNGDSFSFRTSNGDILAWNPWRKVWHDGNFNPDNYLPLSGGNVSGSVGIGTNTPNRKLEVADIDSQFSLKGTITGAPVYQSWYNSSNVRRGYFGFSSESNSNIRLVNEEVGNIYISPNNGSTIISSTVTATSYTATSLPVFENNALASSLAEGQFYRTSTGVLMVKF